jgi:hypothetical protein
MTAAESPGSVPTDTPRTRLAAELRSAYENGARIKDLAVASHRAQSEVRRLLREAGAVLGGASQQSASRSAIPEAAPVQYEFSAKPPFPERELGVLIGLRERPAANSTTAPPAEPRRVAARVVRIGEGTCFAVLPEWRAAIAVPVATSVLLSTTGLEFDQLLGAELTVRIRPDALHDRELAAADWQPASRRR